MFTRYHGARQGHVTLFGLTITFVSHKSQTNFVSLVVCLLFTFPRHNLSDHPDTIKKRTLCNRHHFPLSSFHSCVIDYNFSWYFSYSFHMMPRRRGQPNCQFLLADQYSMEEKDLDGFYVDTFETKGLDKRNIFIVL